MADSVPISEQTKAILQEQLRSLINILESLASIESSAEPTIKSIHPNHKSSAINFLHYLALRQRDLRPLQLKLVTLGLSSLSNVEPCVQESLTAVVRIIQNLLGVPSLLQDTTIDFEKYQTLLEHHTTRLLGKKPDNRPVRIMVTMPNEAASNYPLIRNLLLAGMNCMRINCAHDASEAWSAMIENLRIAEQETQCHCKINMDLAGPKIRTGAIEQGPRVLKLKPQRDALGRVTEPARINIFANSKKPQCDFQQNTIYVDDDWLQALKLGDKIVLSDARHSHRHLNVTEIFKFGVQAEAFKTIYLVPETQLVHHPREGTIHALHSGIEGIAQSAQKISLKINDELLLYNSHVLGHAAQPSLDGTRVKPAGIACTYKDIYQQLKPGEHIWFDDGKIGGIIQSIANEQVTIKIFHADEQGSKLDADKGINLPDSELNFSALTPKDFTDLEFAVKHADTVSLSFVNRAEDVLLLQQKIGDIARANNIQSPPNIILKIETQKAILNLPDILLAAMQTPVCGVMIARGDLAVECGFERLAEVQEEILWLCEAAHIPVIWATQVLEGLAKKGSPSRAEITDAAMSHRAECVMLNKGPHIVDAVHTLDNILQRMQAHQSKKRMMLRALKIARSIPKALSPIIDKDRKLKSAAQPPIKLLEYIHPSSK